VVSPVCKLLGSVPAYVVVHFAASYISKIFMKFPHEACAVKAFYGWYDIEQNCKHLQTDACIWTLIKINQAELKQWRLAY